MGECLRSWCRGIHTMRLVVGDMGKRAMCGTAGLLSDMAGW